MENKPKMVDLVTSHNQFLRNITLAKNGGRIYILMHLTQLQGEV